MPPDRFHIIIAMVNSKGAKAFHILIMKVVKYLAPLLYYVIYHDNFCRSARASK